MFQRQPCTVVPRHILCDHIWVQRAPYSCSLLGNLSAHRSRQQPPYSVDAASVKRRLSRTSAFTQTYGSKTCGFGVYDLGLGAPGRLGCLGQARLPRAAAWFFMLSPPFRALCHTHTHTPFQPIFDSAFLTYPAHLPVPPSTSEALANPPSIHPPSFSSRRAPRNLKGLP